MSIWKTKLAIYFNSKDFHQAITLGTRVMSAFLWELNGQPGLITEPLNSSFLIFIMRFPFYLSSYQF